ncbi:phosphoserine phosphatase [Erythrobacter litoralis]|uniref:Phosphoserine phosphatase n=1 Tax=Erythrobacter litoralis TaxID=39960 RepID=A0A074NM36_9SPHN|nr:phosphoserine phosphatase SerB [Erythrobacter litoralis]AOL23659.1 phosphoserine phosphatase [Erythrobacter litoralis]KEO98857.1 phosphoserine phosphatase [Erythrobacter litoralis]
MLIARLIAETGPQGTVEAGTEEAAPAPGLEARLDAALAAFAKADMPVAAAVMLQHCDGVLQLSFADAAPAAVLEVIDAHFGPCDALVGAPATGGEIIVPHLFVSDMDSTMIGQECIDELADYAGIKDQIAAITERAMQGELDFEAALRERVALLEGLEESAIDRCLSERIRPNPGAATLVATLAAKGARSVLVTGGFHHFADPVGERLGFDRVVGNRLAVKGGVLTGELEGPVTDAGVKARVLDEELAQLGSEAHSLATGDGANDIPMIEAASYGFAYRAKPKARAAANGRIDRGDLTAVLSLFGIPRADWVERA